MRKQGGLILGTGEWLWEPLRGIQSVCSSPSQWCGVVWCIDRVAGGDNSDRGRGIFYEGAMTATYTSAAADDAVQANIIAARYGQ
jgi:hypothetical protein